MANCDSGSESECRKHPSEKPHPGVCPSCLREKLSRISAAGNTNYTINFSDSAYSSFSSSPRPMYNYFNHSSGSSSAAVTSPLRRRRHNRTASDILDSIYIALSGSRCNSVNIYGSGLRKSRSIASGPRINGDDGIGVNIKKQQKKKGGFWSKILHRSNGKKPKF